MQTEGSYHLHGKPGNSMWNVPEIMGHQLNQYTFFRAFQMILLHFVIYPFYVWTSSSIEYVYISIEYVYIKFPPGWIV